jgi:hypothetical protein
MHVAILVFEGCGSADSARSRSGLPSASLAAAPIEGSAISRGDLFVERELGVIRHPR